MLRWGAQRRWLGAAAVTLFLSGYCLDAVAAPTHGVLTKRQVHRIVRMTGYRGLQSHRFDVASVLASGPTTTRIVRLDGARLGVRLQEVRRDLRQAGRLAAGRPRFTTRIKLGPGHKQRITFGVAPTQVLAPSQPYIRYLIFTRRDEPLETLTQPHRIPDVQALTVIDTRAGLNVSLLHDVAHDATWGPGLSAARLGTMVESLNTSSFVFLTRRSLDRLAGHRVDKNKLVAFGREIWSNSLGFAVISARKGTPYRTYVREAMRIRFGIYRRYDLRYLTVPKSQYRHFARP